MKITLISLQVIVVIMFSLLSSNSDAMRCGDKLVSIGDTKAEVLLKCGKPFFENLISFEMTRNTNKSDAISNTGIEEQWTYNQGNNQLLKILTFMGGRLISIEDGERVNPTEEYKKDFHFSIGDTQANVLRIYGEPITKEIVSLEKALISDESGKRILKEVKVEQWTYSPGPGKFLLILTFKNGRLVQIDEGDRQ